MFSMEKDFSPTVFYWLVRYPRNVNESQRKTMWVKCVKRLHSRNMNQVKMRLKGSN